jgi:hypothetical protein
MNKLLIVAVAVMTTFLGWAHSALAEQSQNKGVPVEFFACNWQEGKNMGDLEKVYKKFNQWADKNDSGYSAWILTPQFHDGVDFDIGWMGSWPDANAFGKSQDTWMAGGRELAGDFDEVVDCSGLHQMATAVMVGAADAPSGNGVVMFLACTLEDGKSPADALPVHSKLSAAMKDMGSAASSWLFYPGMGSGDADFDYWSVVAFNNYTEMGAAQEMYINGGGWEKAMGILDSTARCTSPVVFDALLVRAATDS